MPAMQFTIIYTLSPLDAASQTKNTHHTFKALRLPRKMTMEVTKVLRLPRKCNSSSDKDAQDRTSIAPITQNDF